MDNNYTNYELNDNQLEEISGGSNENTEKNICPLIPNPNLIY